MRTTEKPTLSTPTRRPPMTDVRHPIFARLYSRMAIRAEKEGTADHRDEALAGLTGRVIEIGAGSGLNFAHYPSTVTEVLAVEPEPHLRVLAERAAQNVRLPIRVVDGTADALPADDGEFDAGVASLVLCSVPSQPHALAELRRVIVSGGELRYYEHIRSQDAKEARLQDRVDWLWPHLGGGCHPNRDTEAAIRVAGFTVQESHPFRFRPCALLAPVAPHVIGTAIRP